MLLTRTLKNPPLAFRLVIINFLLNLAMETSAVLLPLYAREQGASNLQVGLIVAAYGTAYFLSSFVFGRLSDIHGRVKFIRAGLGLSIAAYSLQLFSSSPLFLLSTRAMVGLCLGITTAAIMAYTYENQKEIGRFTSIGALGHFIGAIVAAILGDYHTLFITSSAASLIAFTLSFSLKEFNRPEVTLALSPLPVFKYNFKVYFGFFIRQAGGFAIWSIFPLYLASLGASKSWIAVMDAVNTGGQFIAIRIVARYNPARIYRIGLIISIIVFIIYGLANNFLQIIPVQIVLAIAYSCLFIGSLNYLLRRNTERGTATGLLYSSSFMANGFGPYLGGAVSQAWGYPAVMFMAAGLTAVGLLVTRNLSRKENISTRPLD